MSGDFNASANISAGVPQGESATTTPVSSYRDYAPDPHSEQRNRRLRSISVFITSLEQSLSNIKEMVELMLLDEIRAEHGYKRTTNDVLLLAAAGYIEKEEHWFVRQDGKYAIAMPNPPGAPSSGYHNSWAVYTWMKLDSMDEPDFVNRNGDTYTSAASAIAAYSGSNNGHK